MQPTRSVPRSLLAGAAVLVALLLLAGAGVAAAGEPGNRGWSTPIGSAEEFDDAAGG